MAKTQIIYTDDRHTKMREYAREFVKRKKLIREIGEGKKPLRNVSPSQILNVQPTNINFKGTEEPHVCSVFGCGKHLSLQESMFGTTCIHHQHKQKISQSQFLNSYLKNIQKKTA